MVKLTPLKKLILGATISAIVIVGMLILLVVLSSTTSTKCGTIVNAEPRVAPKPVRPTRESSKVKDVLSRTSETLR